VRLEFAGSEGSGALELAVEVTPPYPGVLTTLACPLQLAAVVSPGVAGSLGSRWRDVVSSGAQGAGQVRSVTGA
jgi:hypothetical protein